jgi:FAD/FMN-containing dehydrogenase
MNQEETAILRRIVERCGPAAVVAPSDAARRVITIRGETMPAVPLLRPASTDEVAFVLRCANEAGRALIPVGGGTGLVDALKPATGQEWYLTLERMRRIERIDVASRVAVVEAGVPLQALQEAAADQGLLFGVDLGARGSATVGGLISTNAGGERVLRFGMMREQVLGLEVVTADGTVLSLMDEVLKNNAGYDLKQLFIGSEGTLGVVTRAVLRLRPGFAGHHCAMLALSTLDDLPRVLMRIEQGLGGTLSAFELMWPEFLQTMTQGAGELHRMPLSPDAAGYLLIEAEGGYPASDQTRLDEVLESMLADGSIADAAVAQSESDRESFWKIRNDIERIMRTWSPLVGFDVSVPIAQMAGYVAETRAALRARWPAARLLVFGHVADNNLHVVATIGEHTMAQHKAIAELVYAGVTVRRGSISAEHGIGLEKRQALQAARSGAVMSLMRSLKHLLDPNGTLNPNKVV